MQTLIFRGYFNRGTENSQLKALQSFHSLNKDSSCFSVRQRYQLLVKATLPHAHHSEQMNWLPSTSFSEFQLSTRTSLSSISHVYLLTWKHKLWARLASDLPKGPNRHRFAKPKNYWLQNR